MENFNYKKPQGNFSGKQSSQPPQRKNDDTLRDNKKEILQIYRFNEQTNVYKILNVELINEKVHIKMQSGTKGDNNNKNIVKIVLEDKEIIQLSKTLEILYDIINRKRINDIISELNNLNK